VFEVALGTAGGGGAHCRGGQGEGWGGRVGYKVTNPRGDPPGGGGWG
jgi:hypothetical protein